MLLFLRQCVRLLKGIWQPIRELNWATGGKIKFNQTNSNILKGMVCLGAHFLKNLVHPCYFLISPMGYQVPQANGLSSCTGCAAQLLGQKSHFCTSCWIMCHIASFKFHWAHHMPAEACINYWVDMNQASIKLRDSFIKLFLMRVYHRSRFGENIFMGPKGGHQNLRGIFSPNFV